MSLHGAPRATAAATAVFFGLATFMAPLREARADDVSGKGKGMVGGGLLGAEVVTIGESLVGVRPGWAYVIGALVGAGGGGAGGYALEKSSTDGKVPTYLLAGGLALVIPALVLTLNATRYMPEEGATEDKAPTGPAAEPGVPGAGVVAPGATAPANVGPAAAPASPPTASPPPAQAPTPPQSLLDLQGPRVRIGVPIPDILPVYSVAERARFGVGGGGEELRLPLVRGTF